MLLLAILNLLEVGLISIFLTNYNSEYACFHVPNCLWMFSPSLIVLATPWSKIHFLMNQFKCKLSLDRRNYFCKLHKFRADVFTLNLTNLSWSFVQIVFARSAHTLLNLTVIYKLFWSPNLVNEYRWLFRSLLKWVIFCKNKLESNSQFICWSESFL